MDTPKTLADVLPDYDDHSLAGLIAAVAPWARVEADGPATEREVADLEARLRIALPEDYRSFLLDAGGVSLAGDESYGFGVFRICGVRDLETTREWLRKECKDWAGVDAWLDREVPRSAPALRFFEPAPDWKEPSLDDKRAALLAKLGLELFPELIPTFYGDLYDDLRIIYHHMVPLFVAGDVIHQGVTCVGPRRQLYSAEVKSWSLERASSSFGQLACEALRDFIVKS